MHMDDISPPTHDPPAPGIRRPRFRVPLGMPVRDEGRRAGAVVSIVIHALIIGLLIVPFFLPTSVIERMQQGAGGAGPAGGGGGGSRGTGGGTVETLRFVKVTTQQVPTPSTLPAITTPVPPPVPVVPPPKPVTPPTSQPQDQAVKTPAPPAAAPSAVAGAGGGSGADGSAGAGPGSGGGVGSGTGTGRGSSNGPGTGGGTATNYPPQPVAMYLPPIPVPSALRGFKLVADFDVDSTGRVVEFKFTPSPDGSYNRQIASTLRSLRFRPGTRPDGTPVRMMAQITYGPF
jgi:protein TonB